MIKPKCVFRIKLEELIQSGGVPEEDNCYRCYGYQTTCANYTTLAHLPQFYQLFKQDRGQTA